ncbi:hypothetical protein Nepgr_005130 [Nepenthes gracilis]|uniref:Uncharacterized protein n=1 Tax=Nepenthes gracilis TaxID=150966 RepID=A0AAD3S334_NEPGR|nr:hypothetical protein Nepgr_005130 [Nepenthes gracilis]
MCHPGFPSGSLQELAARHRWLTFGSPPVPDGPARMEGTRAGNGGGRGGSVKKCVCSPTRHPGSFRCRHHHAEYVWRGNVAQKSPLKLLD